MGHTYGEMFPKEAAEEDRFLRRKICIFNKMKNIPLEKLTLGELMFYLELHFKQWRTTSPDDLDKLEDLLEKISEDENFQKAIDEQIKKQKELTESKFVQEPATQSGYPPNETICGCGHPTSMHGLYGCSCGCTESRDTLEDMDELSGEIIALQEKLDITQEKLDIAIKWLKKLDERKGGWTRDHNLLADQALVELGLKEQF